MKNKIINPQSGETNEYKNLTDVQTQEKINKHMTDIDDKITDEDIRNIRTDMYDELLRNEHEDKDTAAEKDDEKDELTTEEKEKEKEKKESQKINSTWNIMEE
jgi:hypothetical protein